MHNEPAPLATPRWQWRSSTAVALVAVVMLTLGLRAEAAGLVRLEGIDVVATDGAIVLRSGGVELVYVDGFGWLADLVADPPTVRDDGVYVDPSVALALGVGGAVGVAPSAAVDGPRLVAVRFAGETVVRVVADLSGIEAWQLAGLTRSGSVSAGERLALELPRVQVEAQRSETFRGLEVRVTERDDATLLELGGAAFTYEVFALPAPTRLVIDVTFERPPIWVDRHEVLRDGVSYQRLRASGAGGATWVHVIEVAADVGEWRVVGTPGEARTTDRWADGAFAAINGGYFDTSTRQVIGMLMIDRQLLSLPSRGRAVIAFGDGPPIIDRVTASYSVWLDGRAVAVRGAAFVDQLSVVHGPGSAGSGRFGVLVVDAEDGRLVSNSIGPVRLSAQQYAVIYPAELRPLALAEPGSIVRYAWYVDPAPIGAARYAVEAGPLLLKDGIDVLSPELEQFAVGQRILDGLTQQAAIGVRADGSVVMVAAESMVASDLVPLLQELGVRDALRLDSGGSTTLYADGRVFNRISEREVVNAIVLRLP